MAKPIITIAFLINIALSIIFSILWMKNVKSQLSITSQQHGQYDWIIASFRELNRYIFSLKSIEQVGAYLSIFLLVFFVLKSICEIIAEYSSLKLSKITKCLSNIVESTLLFTVTLGFILIPMFITNYQIKQQKLIGQSQPEGSSASLGQKYGNKLIWQIIETFFYGRLLFAIGYLFGIFTTLESFRAYGVALTMVSLTLAFSYVYDFNIWAYF